MIVVNCSLHRYLCGIMNNLEITKYPRDLDVSGGLGQQVPRGHDRVEAFYLKTI